MKIVLTRRGFGAGMLVLAAVPALAQEKQVIEGEILYRERIALPDIAQVELSLQDVSRADAPATFVSSAVIPAGAGSPIPFRMTLSDGALDPRRTYSLRARILVDDQVWFTSTGHVPVSESAGKITIPVQRSGAADATAATPYGSWILVSLGDAPVASEVQSDLTMEDSGTAHGSGGVAAARGQVWPRLWLDVRPPCEPGRQGLRLRLPHL